MKFKRGDTITNGLHVLKITGYRYNYYTYKVQDSTKRSSRVVYVNCNHINMDEEYKVLHAYGTELWRALNE